jgi:hypothetical protein
MEIDLPDGTYPFIYERHDLSDMSMIEAPIELEQLLKSQAQAKDVEIARDVIVELTCKMPDDDLDAKFVIYWPSGQDRIHILAPKSYLKNRA